MISLFRQLSTYPFYQNQNQLGKLGKEASDAKAEGENRLAYALPGLGPAQVVHNVNSKRLRGPVEGKAGEADIRHLGEIEQSMGTPRKKRGKLNAQQRVEVAEIRKLGACLRCAIHKTKVITPRSLNLVNPTKSNLTLTQCSRDIPCDRCITVARSSKMIINIPYWRSKLSATELYRRSQYWPHQCPVKL
jgi:hypothetical protein